MRDSAAPTSIVRRAVAVLSLSAAGLVAIVSHEGYTDKAIVPVQGDRPTVGFGSTFRDDGTPVRMGDTITPQRAVARTLAHIQKDESGIKTCVTAPLSQVEFDIMVDFAYQYGVKALCGSSIVKFANAGQYEQSCGAYLLYKKSQGYDCSTPGNRRCPGVWARSQERHRKCMAAQ